MGAGDALIVKYGSKEVRVPLTSIKNISDSYLTKPERVTLTLREPNEPRKSRRGA